MKFLTFGRAKAADFAPSKRPTVEERLAVMMRELMALQEEYKEELKPLGMRFPLNSAIFFLANTLSGLSAKSNGEKHHMFIISKNGHEYQRNLASIRQANEEMQIIMKNLPEGMPHAYDGTSLVVGDIKQGIAESVYKIELAAAA